tara:strand:+ start:287 stop:493 length:207 start_codon:yes stop_codon:yes gene_type:complete
MKLTDYKKREIKIGDRVKIIEDIPSIDGILKENQIVKISEYNDTKIRVVDSLGKIWWIEPTQVSCSFL